MLILALDTTTRAGSLSIESDGALLDTFVGDASRTHATRLPGDILDCLARQRLTLADIDLYAVAAGPGSFTGLRIGIATIQGLAFAHGKQVVGVSALDALAESVGHRLEAFGGHRLEAFGGDRLEACPGDRLEACPTGDRQEARPGDRREARPGDRLEARPGDRREARPGDRREACPGDRLEARPGDRREACPTGGATVAAWMDARREEVYACLYRAAERAVEPIVPAVVARPTAVLSEWEELISGQEVVFVGDGALAYAQVIEGAPNLRGRIEQPVPPLAPAIARLGRRGAEAGRAVQPHAIRPLYIRRPDAELARDRRVGTPR